jgi:hypothetical protein
MTATLLASASIVDCDAPSGGVFFLLLCALVVLFHVSYDPLPLLGRIATFAPFGVPAGVFLATASARTFLRGDTVHLVSVIVTYLVPGSEIVGLDTEDGIPPRLVSDSGIAAIPAEPAVITEMPSARRGRRAARRMQALLGPLAGEPGALRQVAFVWVPRWTMLVVTIALITLMV